ncbi:MAG: acyl-CoA thioesterase [Pirellulaceae bacterium]
MPAAYRTVRRVEFRDTDAAGIMHFSTFFTYMEEAEHELLRSLGTSVVTPLDPADPTHGELSWPRVAAECQYVDSARFEDMLEIEVQVARIGSSSVTYQFCFRVDGRQIAHGSLTGVCCRITPGHPPKAVPIADWLREQLTEFQLP